MDGQDWLWVIIGIVVVAAIVIGLSLLLGKRRTAAQAAQADSLRQDASERSTVVEQREAKAAEMDARARAAQAESDAKAAEAARLQGTAERQAAESAQARAELDEQLQRADQLDPAYSADGDAGASRDADGRIRPEDSTSTTTTDTTNNPRY
jgi:hypothetical protein